MRRRAASAVEFALTLPLFLALAAATIEYGNVYLRQMDLVGIVREATREGIVRLQSQNPDPTQEAHQSISQALAREGYAGSINVTAAIRGTAPHQVLDVRCALPYEPLIGLVPVPSAVSAEAVMRLYDQR